MFSHIESISLIINKYDPVELIDEGCPKDEYSPEAHLIFAYWTDNLSFENFHFKVYNIFRDQFGRVLERKQDYFLLLSRELWSYLKRNV